jgi:hypothetical protein
MKLKYLLFLISFTSCGFLKTPPSNEPDLGAPSKQFEVNIQGDRLYQLINLPITNDTIKNLLVQLGKHSYSTSRDEYDPYATTAMTLYYEFEGITLVFNGPDAGTNEKTKVTELIKQYPHDFILEQIDIEPAKYKGALPKNILATDKAFEIEKKLGKHNEHFQSNLDPSQRVQYIYPHHGLDIQFNFHPGGVSLDSNMYLMVIKDSLKEKARFPTIYSIAE